MIMLKNISSKENNNEGVGKLINKIVSIASYVFVIGFVGVLALWTKPFLADYYQKMANSHYDSVQSIQMGPVFLMALFFSIYSFMNRRYLVGILTIIIAIWSFYWAFLVGFSCHSCTYGG